MQLIAETYFAMKHLLALKNEQMADIFEQWDKGRLHSYLIEITSAILRHKEKEAIICSITFWMLQDKKERVAGVSLTPYN